MVDSIRRRIPDHPDLVTVDLEPGSRRKIPLPNFSKRYECSLPDQIIYNPACSFCPSEIADIDGTADVVVDVPFSYDDIVNLQDVTGLETADFNYKFKVIPNVEPITNNNPELPITNTNTGLRGTKRFNNEGKTVDFLEKFKDLEFISNT